MTHDNCLSWKKTPTKFKDLFSFWVALSEQGRWKSTFIFSKMVSLNLPHHPFLLLYLVLLLLSKEIVEKGVPIIFWDLKSRQEAKGGGCLHSLLLEDTLLTAVLAQMLESGYCCWPKTGSKLGSGSVLMLLETRPWRGCTNLPSNISLLLSSRNWKTAPILLHDGNCLENLGKNSGSSGWPDTGKGQDDWDSTFHN